MCRGLKLNDFEKGKIDLLLKQNCSLNKIAEELKRSRAAIQNYVKPRPSSPIKKRLGRKKLLGPKTQKKIIDLAKNKTISCNGIKRSLDLEVSKSTIHRTLSSSGDLKFMKMKGKPALKQAHKDKRFEFAIKHRNWGIEWERVIFSDEKKFNLDGPDGFHYYWHDFNQDEISFSRRVLGRGGVMVWAAFESSGKFQLVIIEETMNAQAYTRVLENGLLPFGSQLFNNNYIFQQDNAPCHRAYYTKEWLANKDVEWMDWPPLSPDLNPIENLWGLLSRGVYASGKQFNSVNELKASIFEEWDKISNETLSILVSSMNARIGAVLENKGDATKY